MAWHGVARNSPGSQDTSSLCGRVKMTPAAREPVNQRETTQTFPSHCKPDKPIARRGIIRRDPVCCWTVDPRADRRHNCVRWQPICRAPPGRPIFMSNASLDISIAQHPGMCRQDPRREAVGGKRRHHASITTRDTCLSLRLTGRSNLLKTSGVYLGRRSESAGQAEPNRPGSPETRPQGCACGKAWKPSHA